MGRYLHKTWGPCLAFEWTLHGHKGNYQEQATVLDKTGKVFVDG